MSVKKESNVLVVGCGGLGSEVVKLLRAMELRITVVDYDVVETSNLNRQFFFQQGDIGNPKAKVISEKLGTEHLVCKVEELKPVDLDAFDTVFLCLDSVASRMHMNYIFLRSRSRVLVDCGVEGFKAHAKRVTGHSSCLYCIKELYSVDSEPYICSVRSPDQTVTAENRDRLLRSAVFQRKEHCKGTSETYASIAEMFNSVAPAGQHTSAFEVEGIFNSIIPNICTINSICASLGVVLAFQDTEYDFVYFNGQGMVIIETVSLCKDTKCFVCNIQNLG